MEQPQFSVVVATYNACPYLQKTLQALLALEYDSYEVIVVNDGSTDGTRAYMDFLSDPRLRVAHNEKNLQTCESRNRGIALARGQFIAFTDHDCLPRPDWLQKLAAAFKNGEIGFVFGQVAYVREGYRGYFPERLVQNDQGRWPMGCNLAFRKEALEKTGGFDPEYFKFGNEDTELALRAVTQGVKYKSVPEAVVFHQAMDWSVAHLWRSARNASVWPRLKKKYPQNYLHFRPHIWGGVVIDGRDYLYILTMPILVPILLVRYWWHGKRDLKIFFAKWPLHLWLKRWFIWHEAVRNRSVMF
ncbi:glycosyltransferase family 2 protein [Patescibacteria group bacterium]|nr:MAG: glycosyltransferase family 2 protein [Patescibacteria group bacterium]